MTKDKLKKLYVLNRECEEIVKELEELKYKELYNSPVISDLPKAKITANDKLEQYVIEKIQLEELLQAYLIKIQHEKLILEKYIETIEDDEIRLIFRLKHVSGLTLDEIAVELGVSGYNKRSTISKKYYTFLRKEGIK